MNLDCKKPPLCDPAVPPKEIYPPPTAPFSFCVGGMTIHWDGSRLRYEQSFIPADGTYDTVTVVNGCITGYGHAVEPTYTPPYCNPLPANCQDTGGGGSGGGGSTVTVSPMRGNLTTLLSSGLYTTVSIRAGDGVTVSGSGAASDPITISAAAQTDAGTLVARNGLRLVPGANNEKYIEMEPSGVVAGVYGNITVDMYGRIKEITDGATASVGAGTGLIATQQGDSVVIGHPTFNLPATARFGGFNVAVNPSGHITDISRDVTVADGVYNIGAYNVGIDEYGGVTSIAQRSDIPDAAGAFTTVDGKTVSYDITGRITAVTDPNAPVSPGTAAPPAPLRDMYRVTVTMLPAAMANVSVEAYGNDLTVVATTGTHVIFTLPAYVATAGQVAVHNSLGYNVDTAGRQLSVKYREGAGEGTRVFTVAFRG